MKVKQKHTHTEWKSNRHILSISIIGFCLLCATMELYFCLSPSHESLIFRFISGLADLWREQRFTFYSFIFTHLLLVIIIIGFFISCRQKKKYSLLLENKLYYDNLTGLPNRDGFLKIAEHMFQNNPKEKYALAYCNIVNFKAVNELFGAENGDLFLRNIAKILSEEFGDCLCGRMEADHFVIFMGKDKLNLDTLTKLCSGIWYMRTLEYHYRLRFGIYLTENEKMPVSSMCDKAKLAKKLITDDYNCPYAFYQDELQKNLFLEQAILNEMEQALYSGQFEVYYQPVIRVETGEIVFAEALVRWNHPEAGLLSPAFFLPVFEKNGFIVKLDNFVAEQARKMISAQFAQGKEPLCISVNLSRMNFLRKNMLEDIRQRNTKADTFVWYEITESAYLANDINLMQGVKELKNIGHKILLDDFGSGYSSLHILRELPVDFIKLDMEFIKNYKEGDDSGTIIESIIDMVHKLGKEVVVEGVETRGQYEFLKKVRCDYIQGYYFSKPLAESELKNIINNK